MPREPETHLEHLIALFQKDPCNGGTINSLEEADEKRDGSAVVDRKETTGRHITLVEVMRPAISVRQNTRAGDALKTMLNNGVTGVAVANQRGYVVGFLAAAHLLASTLPNSVTFADNLRRFTWSCCQIKISSKPWSAARGEL